MTLVTLTFDLVNPKSWCLVFTKTNKHVKYESSVLNSFKDNYRKPFGLPMDRLTDISKTTSPLFFEGGGRGGITNTDNKTAMVYNAVSL